LDVDAVTDSAEENWMAGRGSAVVIGAGFAGLATARVLSNHFGRVVVFDRDDLAQGPAPRRCVPQGEHVHLLLSQGFRILNRMFPTLTNQLIAVGAEPFDIGQDLEYWRRGHRKLPFPRGLATIAVSRPALEAAVRERVMSLGNVDVRANCPVRKLLLEGGRVLGVQLEDGHTCVADFVVDAAGRGSRFRRWLEELDHPTPRSTNIEIELGYASRFVRLRDETSNNRKMLYVGPSADTWTRGGALMKVEGKRALMTLAGYLRDHPPLDDQGFSEFAASLGSQFAEAVRGAEYLGSAHRFTADSMVRHHFEELKRHPAGLLGIGDSICLLDPSFGQGMTLALLQAELLDSLLLEGRRWPSLQTKFYRRAKALIDLAWEPAAAENFRRPGMQGTRPALLRAIHWYSGKAMELADRDPDVHRALQESLHLTAGPLSLLRPPLLSKVLLSTLARGTTRTT
jgi:2-polyprenyl-6-methoxyphenol hydroxylase-like FAD-dependent oxidoreductase